MPRLEPLHRQARLARRTQPRSPRAHPGKRSHRQTDRNPHRPHRIRRRPRPRSRAGLGKNLSADETPTTQFLNDSTLRYFLTLWRLLTAIALLVENPPKVAVISS